MRWHKRLYGWAFLWLPLIVLTTASITYLIRLCNYLSPRLAPVVSQVAAQSLNRNVRIGKIDAFGIPGKVILDDISVSNAPSKRGAGTTSEIAVRRIEVDYSLSELIAHPTAPIRSINQLVFYEPNLFVERLGAGVYNFSDLFSKKSSGKPQPFLGVIKLISGSVTVKDDLAPTPELRRPETYEIGDARVDLTSIKLVGFSLNGASDPRFVKSLSIRGQVLRTSSPVQIDKVVRRAYGYGLDVRFAGADLAHYAPYFTPRPGLLVKFDSGTAQGEVTVKQTAVFRSPLLITGHLAFNNATARLLESKVIIGPVSHAFGLANFTQKSAEFSASALIDGQSVSASGDVLNFKRPEVYVLASGTHINYTSLRKSLPELPKIPQQIDLDHDISVQSWLTGRLSDITVDATVKTSSFLAAGYRFGESSADVTYNNKLATVHSVTIADTFGGLYSGSGLIDASGRTPKYHLFGQAEGLSVQDLPFPARFKDSLAPLTASVSGVFDATQSGVNVTVASIGGKVHGISFASAGASMFVSPNSTVEIKRLFVRQKNAGIVVASGEIDPVGNSIDLQFRGTQVDVSKIGQSLSASPIDGIAYANGVVTGRLNNPDFTAHLFVLQPRYGKFSLNLLTADMAGNFARVNIGKAVLSDVPGDAEVNGQVAFPFSHNPALDLAVKFQDVPVSSIENAAASPGKFGADLPITGFANGNVTITGSERYPIADASFNLNDGTVQDFQLTKCAASVQYEDEHLNIEGVRATIAGVDIAGSGTYAPGTGDLSLDMNATAGDLRVVTQKYAPNLGIFGGLRVAAVVSGSVKDPMVTATISTKDLSVEGNSLSLSPSTFRFENSMLQMTRGPLTVSSDEVRYILNQVDLNFANKTIDASGAVTGESLTHIISVIHNSAYLEARFGSQLNSVLAKMASPPTGKLDVDSVDVIGQLSNPTVAVSGDLTDANIGGQAISRLHTKFTVHSTLVSLNSFQMIGPNDAFLELSGAVDTEGPIDAKLEASGISLSLLSQLLPLKPHITGTLADLSIVATGRTNAPQLAASISLDKPSYNGVVFDRVDSGEIDVKNQQIDISRLTFTKEETGAAGPSIDHTLDIDGTIPFEWKPGAMLISEFPQTVPISLNATVPLQSVSFVNQMLPELPIKVDKGMFEASVKISGTLADKQVNGQLTLTDGTLRADGYQTTLEKVNVGLSFDGKNIKVEQANAVSNFGGTVTVTGGGEFSGGDVTVAAQSGVSVLNDLSLSLNVGANNLIINERKISVFDNAGASARFNEGFSVTGPIMHPLIQGQVDIDKVTGSLPQTTEQTATLLSVPAFNPRFDVTINIKPEALVKTPQLNAQADGSVVLAGSYYRPRVDGTFLIRKGEFYFPTATFKVVPSGTLKFHYSPPDAISETIQMTATTSISVTPDIIARNPAGANTTTTYMPPSLTSTVSSSSQRYVVTVEMDGDLEDPQKLHLSFQSNPPGLTDSQILAVLGGQETFAGLTGGNIISAVQNQVASVFNASVVPKILQPFEDTLGTVLGLEDLSIDYAPESPVQVTIVKRIGSRLNVQYTQSVDSRTPGAVSSTLDPPVYQIKLGYSLTPQLQATISTDDQHENIIAIEGIHNF